MILFEKQAVRLLRARGPGTPGRIRTLGLPLRRGTLLLLSYRRKRNMTAKHGIAPCPHGLTDRRAAFTPLGNGLPGRDHTGILRLRRSRLYFKLRREAVRSGR